MTTEARERLAWQLRNKADVTLQEATRVLDAILTDYDDLAALVDWPELLAAGDRVGALHTYTDTHGQASEDEWDEVWVLADQPNGADAPTGQEVSDG